MTERIKLLGTPFAYISTVMKAVLIFLSLWGSFALAQDDRKYAQDDKGMDPRLQISAGMTISDISSLPSEIILGEGEQKTLFVKNLIRVAISNSKIALTHVLKPGNEVLIQALKQGDTTLTLWIPNEKKEIPVSIYPLSLSRQKKEIERILEEIEGIQIQIIKNKIAITGTIYKRKDQENIEKLIQASKDIVLLATPTSHLLPMVQIDVKFLEISKKKQLQLGLEYPNTIKVFSLQDLIHSLSNTGGTAPSLDVFLHLLSEKGYGKVLSNPKLICKSGSEAKFLAGGEIPIRIISKIMAQITWRSYGMVLRVVPSIDREDNINADITVELSSLDAAHTTDGIPGLLTRRLETALNVKKGETIILSGLLNMNSSETTQQVPGLGDIPIIGELFKTKSRSSDKTELLIIVTPTLAPVEKLHDYS